MIRKLDSAESLNRLYRRLADIQAQRSRLLGCSSTYRRAGGWRAGRSDALHDLAMEERRIRRALGLPPSEWTAGVWPDWVGWSLLTGLVVGIFLLAWMAG